MNKRFYVLAILAIPIVQAGCQSMGPNGRTGGTVGGLSGATIGALAGLDRGKSLEGAAIGAAAGTVLGSSIGNQIDRDIARDGSIRQARFEQAVSRAVTVDSVSQMVASGLSDEVIAEHVRANGVLQRLSAQDLIALKQRGVSDRVINTMQQAPLVSVIDDAPAVAAYPIVAREPCYPPPPVFFVEPRWRHHCPPGAYWHFEF